MSTSHQLIPTTNPEYAKSSGLMLEMSLDDGQTWSKLRSASPYAYNKPVSAEKQARALEEVRDGWVTRGPSKYRTAKYRIGEYIFLSSLEGYAWKPYTKDEGPANS